MTETEAKRAEEALTQALLRAPRQFLPLVRAGVLVKKTGFNHQKGLKAWCQERPHLFTVRLFHLWIRIHNYPIHVICGTDAP